MKVKVCEDVDAVHTTQPLSKKGSVLEPQRFVTQLDAMRLSILSVNIKVLRIFWGEKQ